MEELTWPMVEINKGYEDKARTEVNMIWEIPCGGWAKIMLTV